MTQDQMSKALQLVHDRRKISKDLLLGKQLPTVTAHYGDVEEGVCFMRLDPDATALVSQLNEIDRQLNELGVSGKVRELLDKYFHLTTKWKPGDTFEIWRNQVDIDRRREEIIRQLLENGIDVTVIRGSSGTAYTCPLCGGPALKPRGHLTGMCPEPKVY